MKQRLVILFLFLSPLTMHALPVGNPLDATLLTEGIFCSRPSPTFDLCNPCANWCDAWNVRLGFYGDYVFNRHMEIASGGRNGSSITSARLFTNACYLALNLWNRLDVFTTLGGTEIHIESRTRTLGSPSGTNLPIYIETDTHFSWSLGARATLWQRGCFGIGAEAQYFRTHPHLNFARADSSPVIYFDDQGATYHEWQVGLGLSYRVNIAWCASALVPYVAVKWSHARLEMPTITLPIGTGFGASLSDFKNEQHWGYALGITLIGCGRASVTVEGRFADEKALSLNTQFRF